MIQHTNIKEKVSPFFNEIIPGHRYCLENRYTLGSQVINFMRLMTYKELMESQEFNLTEVHQIVPEGKRDCESCEYFIVGEGVFTQDVAKVLKERLDFQLKWLPNGFYNCAKIHAEEIINSFGRYEIFRAKFGFYHVPFTKDNFFKAIEKMSERELLDNKKLIDEFMNWPLKKWNTKEVLLFSIASLPYD